MTNGVILEASRTLVVEGHCGIPTNSIEAEHDHRISLGLPGIKERVPLYEPLSSISSVAASA